MHRLRSRSLAHALAGSADVHDAYEVGDDVCVVGGGEHAHRYARLEGAAVFEAVAHDSGAESGAESGEGSGEESGEESSASSGGGGGAAPATAAGRKRRRKRQRGRPHKRSRFREVLKGAQYPVIAVRLRFFEYTPGIRWGNTVFALPDHGAHEWHAVDELRGLVCMPHACGYAPWRAAHGPRCTLRPAAGREASAWTHADDNRFMLVHTCPTGGRSREPS